MKVQDIGKIQLHSRKPGGEWGIRNAFIDENKLVFAGETNPNVIVGKKVMTRQQLINKAHEYGRQWSDAQHDGSEYRVVDTANLPKAERALFEKGR